MIRKISDGSQGLKILLPLPRVWPLAVFLGLWLVPWGIGEWNALKGLFTGGFNPGSAFLLVWLAGWTAGGAVVIFTFLASVAGEEEVACDGRTFSICWGVLGWGFRKRYPVEAVKAMGRAPATARSFIMDPSHHGKTPPVPVLHGLLFFLAGKRPIPFGWSLTEAEAETVLARLRSRHPFPVPGEGGVPPADQIGAAGKTVEKSFRKTFRFRIGG